MNTITNRSSIFHQSFLKIAVVLLVISIMFAGYATTIHTYLSGQKSHMIVASGDSGGGDGIGTGLLAGSGGSGGHHGG